MHRRRFRSGSALALAIAVCTVTGSPTEAQTLDDPTLVAELVADGLGSSFGTLSPSFVFVSPTTLLVVNRGDGKVRRVDLLPGAIATTGAVVLDLAIISPGTDSQSEYGVQSIELHSNFAVNKAVYIKYDKSPSAPADIPQSDVILGPNFSASLPTVNVIERYQWIPASTGFLFLNSSIHEVTIESRYHHGGPIVFDSEGLLYTVYGDLRRHNAAAWVVDDTDGPLLSVNNDDGAIEDLGTIIRLEDDGSPAPNNPFLLAIATVGQEVENWYWYGVRNSFGLAIDPVTGFVWNTENGVSSFDEINMVTPGGNSGWRQVMGPLDHPGQGGSIDDLVVLPGSVYVDPVFSWLSSIGVTGLAFLNGSSLGPAYDNTLLVGCYNLGHLWAFRLNAARDGFLFHAPALQDGVDDRPFPLENPPGPDGAEIVIGVDFGGPITGIIAIEVGPDGWPYLLTGRGELFRIRRIIPGDVDGNGVIDVIDLLALLNAWGPCPRPCPPECASDTNDDCVIDVVDLLALIASWS